MRGLAKIIARLCKGPGYHTSTVARFPAGDVRSLRLRTHSAFDARAASDEHDADGAPTQQLRCSSAAHAYIAAHFIAAAAATTVLLELPASSTPGHLLASGVVLVTLFVQGLLFDGSASRLVLPPTACLLLQHHTALIAACAPSFLIRASGASSLTTHTHSLSLSRSPSLSLSLSLSSLSRCTRTDTGACALPLRRSTL